MFGTSKVSIGVGSLRVTSFKVFIEVVYPLISSLCLRREPYPKRVFVSGHPCKVWSGRQQSTTTQLSTNSVRSRWVISFEGEFYFKINLTHTRYETKWSQYPFLPKNRLGKTENRNERCLSVFVFTLLGRSPCCLVSGSTGSISTNYT